MKKTFSFIAILTLLSVACSAQDYDFKFSKVQRSVADSLKRGKLIAEIQKLAEKTEKDNPAVSAVLLTLVTTLMMDKEKVLAYHCEYLSRGMVMNYLKEIQDAENLLEIMRKATENIKKKPE